VPKGMLFVESRPADPAREDEYNEWYSRTHIPEVCAVPGIVAARRYRVHRASGGEAEPSAPAYVAVYDIDSDDLDGPLRELGIRAGDGRVRMSDAIQMDPPPTVTIYELVE